MKKFKCEVITTSEYEIEIDDEILNEEYLEDFKKHFYDFDELYEHAEYDTCDKNLDLELYDNVLNEACKRWGADAQIKMAIEEMSELIKELCKNFRGRKNNLEISEEIADVEIMIDQLKKIFDCHESVEKYKIYKIDRLNKKLNE